MAGSAWLAPLAASLLLGQGYGATLVTAAAIAALTASCLRFVLLIGELNFAIAAFFGLGAYSAGFAASAWGWAFPLALTLGGLVAGAVSIVFGFVTLKTKGPYFLLIGFAFTEVMRIVYTKTAWLGGNSGMVGIFPPPALEGHFQAFAVALAGGLIIALYAIERSHLGCVFVAIRDNENVVRSVGIRAHAVKIICFVIASVGAGLAGSLHAFANNVISPPEFGFLLSTFALAYLKVGGEEHPAGPVLGAVVMILLGSLAQSFGSGEHIVYGAAIVLAVLFMPRGLAGAWRVRRSARAAVAPVRPQPRESV
jgi:branched-chain amino acid transport system permease protein